jgi:formate dehydrogenase subunit delta
MSTTVRILDDDRLVHKVNQIAHFHEPYPQDQAVAGVLEHLKNFWTPAMRRQLIQFAAGDDAGRLHELVREAVRVLEEQG